MSLRVAPARRIGCAFSTLLLILLLSPRAHAATPPLNSACDQASPSAAFCVGLDKLADAASTQCRALGVPDSRCVLPAGQKVLARETAAYLRSWTHRTVEFQYALGDPLPLIQAQWLGTHNSFNSFSYGPTPSRLDSNQQLTLSQQLAIDMRALELDTHWMPAANSHGGQVVICHGRDYSQANLGCTTESPLPDMLSEIDRWLNAHPTQVILLYLDDNFGPAAAYTEATQELDAGLVRPDGSSLIYRPTPSTISSSGCAQLPLDTSRDHVREAGKQVILVAADCASGWSSDVFSWRNHEVESGSTPGFKPYPACDATYSREVYATHLVRYFEDSTFVSAVTNPTQTPAEHQANALSPADVSRMTSCGVNLFGFDQILPDDGRLAAAVWSWADGEPRLNDGQCTFQGANGRWSIGDCATVRPAACTTAAGTWVLSAPVDYSGAAAACSAQGATFNLPRSGLQNSVLHTVLGGRAGWLHLRFRGHRS
jgi:hypothetical protein